VNVQTDVPHTSLHFGFGNEDLHNLPDSNPTWGLAS
jgi:hypothetical protein